MKKRNLLQIRIEYIRNIDCWEKAVIEAIVRDNPKKFDHFKGFLERRVYTGKNKIITEAYPINVLPSKLFADAIQKTKLKQKKK